MYTRSECSGDIALMRSLGYLQFYVHQHFICACPFGIKVISRAQWLSGRVFDSRPMGHGFEPHRRHRVVSLSLVLVRPFITERLLKRRKESNQTNKTK